MEEDSGHRTARTGALGWCYFQRAAGIGVEVAETEEDAGTVGWRATWTLVVGVAATSAVLVAVAIAETVRRERSDA